METKVCYCCGVEKPVSEFNKDKSRGDGYNAKCRSCVRSYYLATKDKRAAQTKEYRDKNRVKIATRMKGYYQANKASYDVQRQEYRAKNKEKIAEQTKSYYRRNKTASNARMKKHYLHNKAVYYATGARRRAVKLQATPPWVDLGQIAELFECCQAFRLYTGLEYQVDHIVPLQSKKVCGLHCDANLQVLLESENKSKGNRYWPNMP